jgi:hypothetical protein
MTQLRIALLLFLSVASSAAGQLTPGKLLTVRNGCENSPCEGRHAIVFVHGIYGGAETFTNNRAEITFHRD